MMISREVAAARRPRHTLGSMATIRAAAASDRSALFELVRAFPTPTPPNSEQFSRALDAKLPDPASCLLVAEHERRLVGYVSSATVSRATMRCRRLRSVGSLACR
jgi:hypothetical protein